METPEHYGLNTILVNCAFPGAIEVIRCIAGPNMGRNIAARKLAHGERSDTVTHYTASANIWMIGRNGYRNTHCGIGLNVAFL